MICAHREENQLELSPVKECADSKQATQITFGSIIQKGGYHNAQGDMRWNLNGTKEEQGKNGWGGMSTLD